MSHLPGPVLVLIDHESGSPRPVAAELVTAGRALGDVHALWLGEPGPDAALAGLGALGVAAVHHPDLGGADARSGAVAGQAVAAVAARIGASLVLVPAGYEHVELVARAGVESGAGVAVDATGIGVQDGRVVVDRSAFAGSWETRCTVTTPLAIVALKRNAVVAEPVAVPTSPAVDRTPVTVTGGGAVVTDRSVHAGTGGPDLASAQVVVVGGRGTEGDFTVLRELAEVLGGAVGATRVATDEGWIDHDTQIGQTGVTVAPRLYIGAGVSGAIHHRGGMQSAGTIVAINTDEEAPIFEIADLGIVGDLHTVVPQAIAELRRLRGGA